MKKLLNNILVVSMLTCVLYACKKDMTQAVITPPASITGFTTSASQLVLSSATDSSNVVTFKWPALNYGVKVIATYSLQFDVPSDTTGTNAWGNAKNITVASDTQKTFLGTDFNALLAAQMGLPTGTASTIVVRLQSAINQSTGTSSIIPNLYSIVSLVVTPYKAVVIYPALLVRGGNSWHTPITRTNGFLLTSVKYDGVYEGYLNLTNPDGWGGDAFQLISTTDGKVYGYGSSSTTMSIGGNNLWLTPSPNYMRVIADINALTINYTPVKFFISGDDNSWSTSATPMKFNSATNQWVATNVTLTTGKVFVFTSNGAYDISFKVDAKGNLIFAGSPTWLGTNIPISKTGTYTVTLDLSGGADNYTYSVK
jgi:hypothetical protein